MGLRMLFGLIKQAIKDAMLNYSVLKKGQRAEYKVLQLSHRIEKGIVLPSDRQKDGWGYQKYQELLKLCNGIIDQEIQSIGVGVLLAYVSNKSLSKKELDKKQYNEIINDDHFKNLCKKNSVINGGGILLSKQNIIGFDSFENVVGGRHSCRDFDLNKPVDKKALMSAITLANRCPSACNRQPYHIYIIRTNMISTNDNINSEYSLIITGIIDAYSMEEYNDWIVSPSIFVGFLVLSLHYYKIGSLIMRKELFYDSKYNKKIKDLCGIPKNEKVVLEIRIGSYKDSFFVTQSSRLDSNSLVTFVGTHSRRQKND